jgi:hypothetical protein
MIHCLLLIGSLLAGQAESPAGEDLAAEVRRLVVQLDAGQLAQREAAEAELLRRGPAVLDLLPPDGQIASAEVQQRLGRLRQKLERLAADAVAQASTITLRAEGVPLSEVFAALQRQSGNTIVDYRRQFGQPSGDPKLKVDFRRMPFWAALDRVLDQAELTPYPFCQQPAIGVVAALGGRRGARTSLACYSGPLRLEPASVVARRDPRRDEGSLVVEVEVAWEPRLRIIGLAQRMADLAAVDSRGEPLPAANREGQLEMPISGSAPAVKLELPFRLPPRGVQEIASLKGKLGAMILGQIETFRFGELAAAKNVERRMAGVTVTLGEVRKNDDAWEVRVLVRFDDAGDALASHRQWIFGNRAFLEGYDGKPIAYDSYETTRQGKNEVGIAYLFRIGKPLADYRFVYKTPGTIINGAFEYELKGIKLP